MAAKERILIVDDEEDIQVLLNVNLSREHYAVITADTGEKAIQLAISENPDLILLDLLLPGMDGLEVCKILKRNPQTENIPIIMLTAKTDEADVVTGLELGADDYISKPFSPKILLARIRRILKKKVEKTLNRNTIKIHDITIDPARYEIRIKDKPEKFTFTEFNILYTLAKKPGIVFTRYQIVDAIHGGDYIISDRAIDVQIAYLRKKLGPYAKYIETVRGVGYRLRDH